MRRNGRVSNDNSDKHLLAEAKLQVERLQVENQLLSEQNELLIAASRYWGLLISKTKSHFGKKKSGTLEEMLNKSFSILELECRHEAVNWDGYSAEEEAPLNSGVFNTEAFSKYCDIETKKSFGKTYPPFVAIEYLILIHEPLPLGLICNPSQVALSKEDAVHKLVKKYKFASSESCCKYLYRQGVRKLPYLT